MTSLSISNASGKETRKHGHSPVIHRGVNLHWSHNSIMRQHFDSMMHQDYCTWLCFHQMIQAVVCVCVCVCIYTYIYVCVCVCVCVLGL